ncbi:TPA: hypothetical protein DCY68_00255 [Candidatus Azambacteria bacterium]|nr:hypothetical protein [Candidatus Azambacteria bacterium]HBA52229.1 hypothetical protein [Candidatus Azambacteria bacterium]
MITPAMTKLKFIKSATIMSRVTSSFVRYVSICNIVVKAIQIITKIKNILARSLVMPQPTSTTGAFDKFVKLKT